MPIGIRGFPMSTPMTYMCVNLTLANPSARDAHVGHTLMLVRQRSAAEGAVNMAASECPSQNQ